MQNKNSRKQLEQGKNKDKLRKKLPESETWRNASAFSFDF